MEIRHIRLEDAEQFVNLLVSVDASNMMLFEPGERKTSTEQEEKRIETFLMQKNSTIIVAEEDERLIGYLMLVGGHTSRNEHSARIITGIAEEFRGRGIAAKLFNKAFRWAKEVGITRLGLTVIKHNEKAFNLYKKLGFEVEGERVHSLLLNNEPVNEIYLYKLIE